MYASYTARYQQMVTRFEQNGKKMSQELHHHFQIAGELGRGRFGTVYLCHRRCSTTTTADAFACKTIDKRRLLSSPDPLDLHCLRREATIMSHLSSSAGGAASTRHLLQLHGSFEDDHSLHLILDLCPSPDLLRRLPLPEPDAAAVMRQLMGAVAACHRLGVVHRDIKPDNILFDARGRLKLADFGSAEFFGRGQPALSGVVGTPYYVAPEVLGGGEYDEKVDVWSAGVVLYVTLAGVAPFDGETAEEIFEAVMRGNLRFPTKIFHSVSALAKDLMRRMMCRDVSHRLSAEQVLRHPWMRSFEESNSVVDLTCPSHPVAAC